ncbi:hypothetical protein Tco_0737953 [Tanacetum coccineum]
MVAAAKLPVLNPGEFKLWKMRIEQYFLMTDYALWEVIVNGDSPPPKRTVDGVKQTYPPTTAERMDLEWQMAYADHGEPEDYYIDAEGSLVPQCKASRENRNRELVRRNVTVETTETKASVAQDGLEIQASDKFKTGVGYDSQMVVSQVFDSQVNDKYKIGKRISDSKDENETEFKSKQRKPSFAKIEFVKSNEHVKTPGESVKKVENNNQAKYPRKIVKLLEGNPHLELQEKGVIDSGCSRHMTGNMSYPSDYEEINGGYVSFGGDPKGGKIIGKCKIRTCKLDFEDVYFVKELKFNLFSVSQMCDKKNNVLFTDTECVVLSPDFKLLDENHVLLRVP